MIERADCQSTYRIPEELARIHFVWGGWGTNSPFFRQRLLAAGIKDITREIYTNDKVYVAGAFGTSAGDISTVTSA